MASIQPGWLGVPIVIVIVIAAALAVTGALYGLVPPARRFIRGDRPIWWVRDGFLAVLVAALLLFGQSYALNTDNGRKQSQGQDPGQDQSLLDLQFVRDRSSEQYQARPFRGLDLSSKNLAGLELMGSDFVEANLEGANLTGTNLRNQSATPEAPDHPAIRSVNTFMQGVNLCNAVLTGADLRYSFLVNANLTGVDLTFTRLRGAALNGSDLSGATMPSEAAYLEGIYYDENTIWPEGFQPPPPAAGNKFDFLQDPVNNELYGGIQRPACNSLRGAS